jgi:outer membrane lipoprotein-sorting protein
MIVSATCLRRGARRAAMALVVGIVLASANAAAKPGPNSTDPRAIMQAVFDRDLGDRMTADLRMTIVKGSERLVRQMQVRSIRFDGGRRTRLQLESPADVRNTGLLTVDYDQASRDDDQWLYLPSVRRSTRISANRRSGAFVGSDFSFSDLSRDHPDNYELRLIDGAAKVDGADVWVIEATPRTSAIRRQTGYSKIELWIDKERFLALRVKASMDGGRFKYTQATDLTRIQGIWVARRLIARTVRGGDVLSESVMEHRNVSFDRDSVTEGDFTTRSLEQGL